MLIYARENRFYEPKEVVRQMGILEDTVDIAYPQQPHCATVLVLDVSASMAGEKILELNEGLGAFIEALVQDDLARKRVDLAIITFGKDVRVACPFSPADQIHIPVLEPETFTPMGRALVRAMDLVEERKAEYRELGIDYYRPWIFLITDGRPSDMHPGDPFWDEVIVKVHGGEQEKRFLFWALGVDKADMKILKEIAPASRPPLLLKETRFFDLFVWLSKSLSRISDSSIGEQVTLDNPAGPDGWGVIPTD